MKPTNAKLRVMFIEEREHVVAYCPALDLYTQGIDINEAKKMFEDAVDLYFRELAELDNYEEVLIDLGWRKSSSRPEELVPPEVVGHYEQKFQLPLRK